MGDKSTVYDNVTSLAAEKGMSINSLEEKAGIARGCIYKWNYTSPTLRSLSKVADVLNCSVAELIKNS